MFPKIIIICEGFHIEIYDGKNTNGEVDKRIKELRSNFKSAIGFYLEKIENDKGIYFDKVNDVRVELTEVQIIDRML